MKEQESIQPLTFRQKHSLALMFVVCLLTPMVLSMVLMNSSNQGLQGLLLKMVMKRSQEFMETFETDIQLRIESLLNKAISGMFT